MSGRSSCPECGTILRIRDRTFVGRRVNCPECKTGMRITTEDAQGDFVARRLTPDELASSNQRFQDEAKRRADKILLPTPQRRSLWGRLLDSPLTVAWLLAIGVAVFVAVLTLSPKSRPSPTPPVSPATRSEPLLNVPSATDPDPEQSAEEPSREQSPPPEIVVLIEREPAASPVSALEPANLDEVLPWSPLDDMVEAVSQRAEDFSSPPPSPPVKIDVEARLLQKLVLYKQAIPAKRSELIEAMEEHLGVPIFYDREELGPERLDQTITFELQNTTLGGVMQKIAESTGWQIQVEEKGLRLIR